MSLPPLPDLCTWGKTVLTREDMIQVRMREYGALCRKMALEEAAKEVDHIMFFNGKTFGEKIRELKGHNNQSSACCAKATHQTCNA